MFALSIVSISHLGVCSCGGGQFLGTHRYLWNEVISNMLGMQHFSWWLMLGVALIYQSGDKLLYVFKIFA